MPVATAWMGENHFAAWPSTAYGVVLLMAGCAYRILQSAIIASHGPDSILREAVGTDWKGKLSPVLYLAGIASTFRWPWVAQGIYVSVALLWLMPDPRIEHALQRREG